MLHQTWKLKAAHVHTVDSEIDLASIFIILRKVCVALFTKSLVMDL